LAPKLAEGLSTDALDAAFERERDALQEELGVPFPGIRLWTRDGLGESSYELLVHDVPSGGGDIRADKLQVIDPPQAVRSQCEQGGSSAGEAEALWISAEALRAHPEVTGLRPEAVIARHAVRVLREQAHQFVGIQEVQWVMENVAKDYPGLVAEVQKVLPLQRISEVMRRLLEEHVSIRNMRAIFESLIVWGPKEKDVLMLTEYVRGDLGRYLTHKATGGSGSLAVVLLDAQVEKLIRESIKPTPAGNYLAMAPDQMTAIAQRIAELAGDSPRTGLAVVTSMDLRRYVRRIVESWLRWLNVYSFQELSGSVSLQPLGRVSL
jgi:type III secretion protein V